MHAMDLICLPRDSIFQASHIHSLYLFALNIYRTNAGIGKYTFYEPQSFDRFSRT